MSAKTSMLRLNLNLPIIEMEPVEDWFWQQGALSLDASQPEQGQQRLTVLFPADMPEIRKQSVGTWLESLGIHPKAAQWEWADTEQWRQLRRASFHAREIGCFWVTPSEEPLPRTLNPHLKIIRIFADQAFGTGEHTTTRMLLEMLPNQALKGKRVLDVGCGTGILAIGAEQLGASLCHGFDIDADCYEDFQLHLSLNHCEHTTFWIGGFDSVPNLKYDCVFANVTLNIHREMLPIMEAWCHQQTKVLGSGVQETQWEELVLAYAAFGWQLEQRMNGDGWLCFEGTRS